VSARVHTPAPLAVVVPREVAPSKTSTVEFASAVPESVTAALLWKLLSAGAVIAGGAGAVASTVNGLEAGVASGLPVGSIARTWNV
jgi:hypothetical protein